MSQPTVRAALDPRRALAASVYYDVGETRINRRVLYASGAPDGYLYAVDHHHMCRALVDANIPTSAKTPVVDVKGDYSDLASMGDFWTKMLQGENLWLYGSDGNGPVSPSLLPTDFSRMPNDPYRSLAWLVRSNGGYEKLDVPFQVRRAASSPHERGSHANGSLAPPAALPGLRVCAGVPAAEPDSGAEWLRFARRRRGHSVPGLDAVQVGRVQPELLRGRGAERERRRARCGARGDGRRALPGGAQHTGLRRRLARPAKLRVGCTCMGSRGGVL